MNCLLEVLHILCTNDFEPYLRICECYPMFQKSLLSKIPRKGHALLSVEEVFGYILQRLPNHAWNAKYFWQFLWLLFQDDHLGKLKIEIKNFYDSSHLCKTRYRLTKYLLSNRPLTLLCNPETLTPRAKLHKRKSEWSIKSFGMR